MIRNFLVYFVLWQVTTISSKNIGSLENSTGFKLAKPCDPVKCVLPDCRCSDTYLSANISAKTIPQLVMLTFDDAVTALNYQYIEEAIRPIRNPDGCPAQATFFVSHEYTDYAKIHSLWAQGHEIALHSITHTPSTKYWRRASVDLLIEEFGGQREMMAHFANIDITDIKGMRVPLFELSGNNSFIALKKIGLLYDSSWPTQQFTGLSGLWPYTLDYDSRQDCPIGRCPTASIPGVWVNPLLNWVDSDGNKCSMIDACMNTPDDDVNEVLNWMISNFNSTYLTNRAPFGLYLHSAWFLKGENYFEAYKKFLNYVSRLPDVYLVSGSRVVEYVRNPRPKKPFNSCQKIHKQSCKERLCQLTKVSTQEERWMKSCVPCPAVYPWLGNPLGKADRHTHNKHG